MATTRSKNTVKTKVVTKTMMSLFGAVLQRWKKDFQSAIFAATIRSTAASVVIGMSAASGISTNRIIVSVIQ